MDLHNGGGVIVVGAASEEGSPGSDLANWGDSIDNSFVLEAREALEMEDDDELEVYPLTEYLESQGRTLSSAP